MEGGYEEACLSLSCLASSIFRSATHDVDVNMAFGMEKTCDRGRELRGR